jgi:3-phosphoshikimate 1-carboxyvinyltransferase
MKIRPARRLRGRLTLPGDKSISHRAGLIAALAHGRTEISNFASSVDCASTLSCLAQLGVRVERDGDHVSIEGAGAADGATRLRPSPLPLDCGNSGTTMRLLLGILAAQPFASTLTGDESLSRRPMRRVMGPLAEMGARVASEEGRPPLVIEGRRPLKSLDYEMTVASAQVKSCVLLAGLGAGGRTRVVEQVLTRDHTERMLRWFGAPIETERLTRADGSTAHAVTIEGGKGFAARDLHVPGDVSSAAFLASAAALLPGSELLIEGVGLNPTRTQFLDTLRLLGADAVAEGERELCGEPVGTLRVRGIERSLEPVEGGRPALVLRGPVIAQLIDELPILAVVGTQAEGGLEIREAAELRVKESDRIRTTVENLRAMGAEVEEFEDGLQARGRARLRGAKLDAHGDHRIAMAFAVAALIAEGETEIAGAEECVGVSFPEFFDLLERVAER